MGSLIKAEGFPWRLPVGPREVKTALAIVSELLVAEFDAQRLSNTACAFAKLGESDEIL